MESIEPLQALLALGPSEKPTTDDASLVRNSSEKFKILFSFYSKKRSDTYTGHTVTSPALISCLTESLSQEYGVTRIKLLHQKKARL